jgi:hypothetical protein
VLQPFLRHRIDEVFPDHKMEEGVSRHPFLIELADHQLERNAVRAQFF